MRAPVDGRFVFWLCVAFVLGIVVSLVVANLGASEKKVDRPLERLHDTRDPAFARDLSVLLGPPLVEGNAAEVLINGDRIFPAMLEDIRSAKSTISFETYIYWDGTIGDEFADALADRARNGVKVHVLLDWVGSARLDKAALERDEGAPASRSSAITSRTGRTCRGSTTARTARSWWSTARSATPAASASPTSGAATPRTPSTGATPISGCAARWWRRCSRCSTTTGPRRPAGCCTAGSTSRRCEPVPGGMPAQMFSSSPSGGAESMHLMYLLAITSAKTSIELSNSYFVPDELTIRALVEAARRGVKVRIIVPGPIIDSDVVRAASRADWGPLLEAGVQIAEYQPTMFHCKVLVVDGWFISVGSTNFDNRSFRLNDEANLNLLDEKFAAEQVKVFEHDLSRSKVVTLAAWRDRPMKERAMECFGQLLKSQL